MPVKRGKVKGRGRGVEKTNRCPIVDLPGYIVNEEANGALVYKRCRGVGAGMLVPPADSSINTGPDFTDSDDSNESMTLPDYENEAIGRIVKGDQDVARRVRLVLEAHEEVIQKILSIHAQIFDEVEDRDARYLVVVEVTDKGLLQVEREV